MEDNAELQENEAKIKSFHVKSDIQYRYAKTVVTSTVVNTADQAKEIFFYIILPESAFISEFQMEIEGNIYKAHVKEKNEAKVEYNEAVSAGWTAGHVEYSVRDSNKFTVSVNVEKEKEVIFKLTYEELLKRELSTYKHYINIDPGQLVPDLKVEISILESSSISILEVPPLRENNELEFESTSVDPLVKIEQPGPNKAAICWAPTIEEQTKLNKSGVKGQLIVRYDVDPIYKPEEVLINNGYFVHFFAPSDITPMRKHAIFVLDVSGSMSGGKIKQLIEAMNTIFSDIAADDLFSLVIFSSGIYVWDSYTISYSSSMTDDNQELPNSSVVPATLDNIQKAKFFVNSLNSGGGTSICGALKKSIEIVQLGKKLNTDSGEQLPEPVIVFLTDGDPTDDTVDNIIVEITSRNSETNAALFSLGFGEYAKMDFLKKLSLRNHGFARKIYAASDAALQLKNFYLQIASPLLSNVKFNYQDDKVDTSSVSRTIFPTLFQGSEFVVVGHLRGNDIAGNVTSGSRNGCCTRSIVQPVIVSEKTSFMERMWAYLTIQQLLDSVTTESDQSEAIKKKALELALKYSFVTSLTSLVVVKPDDKTTSTNTERADQPSYTSSYSLDKGKCKKSCRSPANYHPYSGESLEISCSFNPLSHEVSYSNRPRQTFNSCRRRPSLNLSRSSFSEANLNCYIEPVYCSTSPDIEDFAPIIGSSLLNLSTHGLEDNRFYKKQEDENVAIISKANGLILTSIEFQSKIKYQHAVTEVVMAAHNPTSDLLQGEFYIPLPNDAVISGCILVASNQTITAEATLTSEVVKKLTLHSDNGVLVSREKNEEMKVTLNLKVNENVTVKVMYEEMVKWTGQHYQFVLNTNVHHFLKEIAATTYIEDCVKIIDIKGFFEDNSELPEATLFPCIELPAANKAIVSWTADEEKQRQMKNLHLPGCFRITYGLDKTSVSEYTVTPRGYPLHKHLTTEAPSHVMLLLPETSWGSSRHEASQFTDIHWVIVINSQVKEVVLTLLDVMRTYVPTIISPQFGTMVFNSQDRNSAKNFVSSLQENEDRNNRDALMKALEIPSITESMKKVVIVLDGEKVDSDVVNEITLANKQANVPIFCLTFDETKNIELTKQLASNNSGITRIMYKECPLSVQISDFLQQVRDYLANPAAFKYIEDQNNIDDFWRKSCILSETSETKLTQLGLEASIVTPTTSLMGL